MNSIMTRRQVIRALAAAGSIVLFPIDCLVRMGNRHLAAAEDYELYAGFVLLSGDAPIPPFVQPPPFPPPIVGNVPNPETTPPSANPITQYYDSPTDLAQTAAVRLYALSQLPDGLRLAPEHTLMSVPEACCNGTYVRLATVSYESFSPDLEAWLPSASIIAQPHHHDPYPLWAATAEEEGDTNIVLDRVDYLPSPGIRIVGDCTDCGFVYHWTTDGVLYTFIDDFSATFADSLSLAQSLLAV